MKTFSAKPHEVKREWFVIDAQDKVLGRVAAEVASRLRGKHKPEYTPHVDTGDYIIVINADKLRVTGAKFEDKKYLPPFRFPRRYLRTHLPRNARAIPGPRFGTSCKRYAAQRSSGLRHD
ncbi:50S ribosomal protein L13 [Neisseria meningitidis]|nr:50S ribosomal protein L13 [Neisseria meningitidis]